MGCASQYTPSQVRAGTTVTWSLSLSDYPAPTWSVSYALRGPGVINFTSAADGTAHKILITSAISAGYVAGVYDFVAIVTDGTTKTEIDSGSIEITPDLVAAGPGFDGRTQNKKILDAITDAITGLASAQVQATTINGKSLQRFTLAEKIEAQKYYAGLVANEQRAAKLAKGLGSGRNILVRFTGN